jgi:GalNAc-alpha-(1->4)-GalNAc-alpha-(1->3)-diNAcBac-PP-undecaprenol alpha-1,4-N-acetyl-D-galactosaminyltransferase
VPALRSELRNQELPSDPRASRRSRPDVLLVVSHLGHGGTQRVVCNLANGWSRQGYRVRLLLMNRRRSNAIHLDPDVETEYLVYVPPRWTVLHLGGLYKRARWLWNLRRLIRASRAPLVISFIRSTNAQVLLACLGPGDQRVVICERNDPARQPIPQPWATLSHLLYRTASLVTVNSKGAAKSLSSLVPEHKLAYVPNVLTAAQPTDLRLPAPTIVAGGRLVPQKGLDVLFRAFAARRDELQGWRIALLGEGSARRSLEQLARSLGIDDRIDWPGHVPEPYAYFMAADIFVLPSRYEGMPNSLLEAMSCGLPVVVSDASAGPLEVVEHEKTGLIVPCDDVEALGAAIARLARNPELRRSLGAAGAATVQPFTASQSLATWTELTGISRSGDAARPENMPAPRRPSSLRVFAHFLRQGHLWAYAVKPRIWPEIWRQLRRKNLLALGLLVEDAEAAEHNRDAAVEWCRSLRRDQSDVAHQLLGSHPWVGLETAAGTELAIARQRADAVPFKLGGASNMDLLYNLCEGLSARCVLETGVAYGWSSLAVLLSLKNRPGAMLFSVDLPYLKHGNDRWVGIVVPEYLHRHWKLFRMADREGLPRAIRAARTFDLAHYDSDKSLEGRAFAYPQIWSALRPGGVLVSDDIGDNTAFRDFCEKMRLVPLVVQQGDKFQGIVVKPAAESVTESFSQPDNGHDRLRLR